MSRHAAPDEADEQSELGTALRAALAERAAAERAGSARRRRRGDADEALPAGPETAADTSSVVHAEPAPLGWPATGSESDQPVPGASSPLGWPEPAAAVVHPPRTVEPAHITEPAGPASPVEPTGDPAIEPPPATPSAARPTPSAPAPTPPGPRPAPDSGWRRFLYAASGGLLNLGETPVQRRRRELTEGLAGSTPGCYRIAVISLKGGVGKTTMSVCLGAVLASTRPDRVIAVDANPDRGTLAGKVADPNPATVRDLLDSLPTIGSYGDVRAFTSQTPDRLEILASAADPSVSDAFSEQDYRRVLSALQDYYNVVVTDCGTGLLHSAMAGVLDLADQLVVVATNSVDGANSASATLDWLQAHGHAELVRDSVAVINAVVPGSGRVDQDRLAAHFADRCRAVVRIPHDQYLEAGAEVELAALDRPTHDALLGLATTIVEALPEAPGRR